MSPYNCYLSVRSEHTAGLTAPMTVTVLAGNSSADFTVTAGTVTSTKTGKVKAGRLGKTKEVSVTVNP